MTANVLAEIGESTKEKELEKCGIIMPISAIDGLSAEHWKEVLSIVKDVVKDSGLDPSLVSNADDVGIIQKHTVQDIYNSPILIFDVSSKNPNVMFELGLRLAFDKPTIIIKDDATNYNFDTTPIEHITYPRDLRFSAVVAFKEKLKNILAATYRKMTDNPGGSTFMQELVEFQAPKQGEKDLSSEKYIIDSLERLSNDVKAIKSNINKENPENKINIHSQMAMNKFTDIFLRPENLEIFVVSKIDQFVKAAGLGSRLDIEKQRLQNKVYEYITASNPELDNDVIERLMLEVINRLIKTP